MRTSHLQNAMTLQVWRDVEMEDTQLSKQQWHIKNIVGT